MTSDEQANAANAALEVLKESFERLDDWRFWVRDGCQLVYGGDVVYCWVRGVMVTKEIPNLFTVGAAAELPVARRDLEYAAALGAIERVCSCKDGRDV